MSEKTKEFSLGALLSVTTGYMLVRSFGDVHEVFDHLYPGIMTLGVAMMGAKAKERVLEQHSGLANAEVPDLGGATGEEAMAIIDPWLLEMEAVHGATLPLATDESLQSPEQNGV